MPLITDADNPAQNEFDDLVRRAKGHHVQPLTPGEKAGILWAAEQIRLALAERDTEKERADENYAYGERTKVLYSECHNKMKALLARAESAERAICRAKEVLEKAPDINNNYTAQLAEAALSYTGPCKHAAIAERVIPAIEGFRDTDRPLVENIVEAVKKIIEEG